MTAKGWGGLACQASHALVRGVEMSSRALGVVYYRCGRECPVKVCTLQWSCKGCLLSCNRS